MSKKEKGNNNLIAQIYGAMWASLILLFIPHKETWQATKKYAPDPTFIMVASIFFALILIFCYLIRSKFKSNELKLSHINYTIRTLWFSVGIAPLATLPLAIIYMLPRMDNTALIPCSNDISKIVMSGNTNISVLQLHQLIEPCLNAFIHTNAKTFLIAHIIAGLPIFVYFIYRILKGTFLVLKNKAISNPKSWIA